MVSMSKTVGENELNAGMSINAGTSIFNHARQEDDKKSVTSRAYMTKASRQKTVVKEIYIPQNVNKKECVRTGKGITGIGTAHINPALSGRLTLAMLEKMATARKLDA